MHDPGLIFLICLVLSSSVFLLTLLSTNAAIIFLIFSMLLSPEIGFGPVQPDRAVVIRFDDLLLAIVFITWLAKLAINKQLGVLRSTPMNAPLGFFLASCMASTAWGILNGTVASPLASAFYFVKYFEYFFLFFMVANVVQERWQIEMFLKAMLATLVCVCLYAYWQMVSGAVMRVTAPFEGVHAEPNTLAGYLLVMIAICAGLLIQATSNRQRLLYAGAIVLAVLPFMYTYSRGGYIAFIAMYLTLCLASDRYRLLLWALLVVGILMIPMVAPQTVIHRIAETFDPRSSVQLGGMRLSESPAYRVMVWKIVFEKWLEHPLLGFGVTGLRILADNQHALVLGELGLVGVIAYLWVRWRLAAISYRISRTAKDQLDKGLALGFLAALMGLIILSFAANIFIIVRIMEPFWFLAALVVVLPQLAPAAPPVPQAAPAGARRLVPA